MCAGKKSEAVLSTWGRELALGRGWSSVLDGGELAARERERKSRRTPGTLEETAIWF